MKTAVILILVFLTFSFAEPVACSMLEEGRAASLPWCKCAFKVYDDGERKGRVSVGACGNNNVTIVADVDYNGRWVKHTGTICEKLKEVNKWSCKTYQYLQEDWFNKAIIKTMSSSEFRNGTEDLLDPGDMEYLGLKKKY